MVETIKNDPKVAPKPSVIQAAKRFAEVLAKTPQFQEFEYSYMEYTQDEAAQNAIQEYQTKQESLKALLMLGAVSEENRLELQRLENLFRQQPSVIRYAKAKTNLVIICQQLGDHLSQAIGLDYGNSCRQGGCCG